MRIDEREVAFCANCHKATRAPLHLELALAPFCICDRCCDAYERPHRSRDERMRWGRLARQL